MILAKDDESFTIVIAYFKSLYAHVPRLLLVPHDDDDILLLYAPNGSV